MRSFGSSGLALVLLLSVFVSAHAFELDELQHLIDEGVNVVAARRVQQGELPFRDFLYHQMPTYVFTLSLLPTDYIWYGRLLSMLWLAFSGGLLFAVARRFGEGALAAGLFLFAGMQYYGLLALPNAPMLGFALASVWLVFYGSRPRLVAGALCLAISILYKPLTLVVFLAALAALLSSPSRRRQALPFVLWLGLFGLLAWGAFHVASEGAFTDLLRQQWSRYSNRSGLDLLREGIPAIRPALANLTPLTMNLLLLGKAYASFDALLVLASLAGLSTVWRSASTLRVEDKVLWTTWLVLAPLFSLFVWDLSWEHYHLLDFPPLCLFSALWIRRVAAGSAVRTAGASALLLGYALAGLLATRGRLRDYSAVLELRGESAPLLAFDPTVNVLSRTELACGLQDPFTQRLPGFLGDAFARFRVSTDDIVRCLDEAPENRIVIDQLSDTGLYFIDEELYRYIVRQPESRVLFLGEDARAAFETLY